MTVTLVADEALFSRLRFLADLDIETGGVILARPVKSPAGDIRLLATQFYEVPEEHYERREASQLLIRSDGYVPALRKAEEFEALPIWFHTHPGDSSPLPSKHDKRVDEQLSDLFRLRSESEFYGSLIISNQDGRLSFSGHLDNGNQHYSVDRFFVSGARFSLYTNSENVTDALPDIFDRNIRAFGGDIQRVLSNLRIAIVGCGGTGSAVAEQLVRLGIRHCLLLDPDTLTRSNTTRVYGSSVSDVDRPKVDILAGHLRRIAPDSSIENIPYSITTESVARQLVGVDVVFGCTDDNAGRLILSRLATYFLLPVIDCGVLLTNDSDGRLNGIYGRVTVMHPGSACLVCRKRIDIARAGSEMLTPDERVRRADEGYAPSLVGVEPAVVTFTTMTAATAVNELLERLVRYGADPAPSEILLRIHDREISTNNNAPNQRHYCHPTSGKLGIGETVPFLEQTWQA